jgi:hypothetical protein
MSEQVNAPFSVEGFKADAKNNGVYRRRMRVMEYINDGYGPTIIAERMGKKRDTIQFDIQWLRKNDFLSPDLDLRRKFKPTADMIVLMADMLRKGSTYGTIGKAKAYRASLTSSYEAFPDTISRRFDIRKIWRSTGTISFPAVNMRTTSAVLGPTPGRSMRSSLASG